MKQPAQPEPRVDPPSDLDTETPVDPEAVDACRVHEHNYEHLAMLFEDLDHYLGQLGLDVKQTASLRLAAGGLAAAVEVLR